MKSVVIYQRDELVTMLFMLKNLLLPEKIRTPNVDDESIDEDLNEKDAETAEK